jgi:hypothetical protein
MIVNKASSSRGYHPANPPAGEKHTAGTGTQFFRLFGKNASRENALLRILFSRAHKDPNNCRHNKSMNFHTGVDTNLRLGYKYHRFCLF